MLFLLIEDNPVILENHVHHIEISGHESITTNSFTEARQKLCVRTDIHAIITSFKVSGENIYELLYFLLKRKCFQKPLLLHNDQRIFKQTLGNRPYGSFDLSEMHRTFRFLYFKERKVCNTYLDDFFDYCTRVKTCSQKPY